MAKTRHIKENIRCILWGRSAGRCQKCNIAVSWHPQTKEDANLAEAAHIIGFSENGPRPERDLPEELLNDLSNLMLLCRLCHTPIIDAKEEDYTVERLRNMKRAHEERIDRVTAIGQERSTHILLYGANVGDHNTTVSYQATAPALIPDDRYPASKTPLALGMVNSSFRDQDPDFWQIEAKHLRVMVEQHIRPRMRPGDVEHLSVFALAPQPLLVLLGYLLCDINYGVHVYQLHREPPGWVWQESSERLEYRIERPSNAKGVPALVLALSADIKTERIYEKLGSDTSVWCIRIPEPNNDFLKSAQQLQQYRVLMRSLLDEIKDQYLRGTILNVFPAAPVSVCVELGRVIQPKAHMTIRMWDENKNLGGFVQALDINTPNKEGSL